jgi:hypothetical protein
MEIEKETIEIPFLNQQHARVQQKSPITEQERKEDIHWCMYCAGLAVICGAIAFFVFYFWLRI